MQVQIVSISVNSIITHCLIESFGLIITFLPSLATYLRAVISLWEKKSNVRLKTLALV